MSFRRFSNVVEFWQYVSSDPDLSGVIIDNFLGILSSSCVYEVPSEGSANNAHHQNIATQQPFAIFCALKEIFAGKEIQKVVIHEILTCCDIHLMNKFYIFRIGAEATLL